MVMMVCRNIGNDGTGPLPTIVFTPYGREVKLQAPFSQFFHFKISSKFLFKTREELLVNLEH